MQPGLLLFSAGAGGRLRDRSSRYSRSTMVAFRALRHRNFQLFFSGQMVSLIGSWMQRIAESWLVYQLTHSAWMLGLVAFGGQVPIFLLGPLAGVAADRVNRHRLIVATQTASMVLAFILAFLTFTHRVTVLWILFLAMLLGVVNAFDMPGRQAFILDMVERSDAMNAIALNSSVFNLARLIGPAVAGLIVAAVGEGWCFLINGISYIAVIAGLLAMRLPRKAERPASSNSVFEHFLEGFRYVRQALPLRVLLLLLGVNSLFVAPYIVLLPIYAGSIFHSGASGFGWLTGAAGAGALTGALLLTSREGVRGLGKLIGTMTLVLAVGVIGFAFSRHMGLSLLLLYVVGGCQMTVVASANTLLQTLTEDRFRGRVMSFYAMMVRGMFPFGSLLVGWLAARVTAPPALAAGGVMALLGGTVFLVMLPRFRTAGRAMIRREATAE